MGPDISVKDIDAVRDLGIVSQIRGTHSSGVFQIRSSNEGKWQTGEKLVKTIENFSTLLEDLDNPKSYNRDVLYNTTVDVIMGHVRHATKGALIEKNAHPFRFSKLIGAHNGTLKDQKYMHVNMTDSELMFEDMNNRGVATVLKELDRDSAFALTMYDRDNHCMMFVRNQLRPLSFAFVEDRGVMFYASEKGILDLVLDRAGYDYKVFNLRPNMLVKIYAKEITKKACSEDPLKLLHLIEKLDRPLPTSIQKMVDAREEYEAKKKAEEEKANQEVKTEEPKVEVKVQEEKENKSNILSFPPVNPSKNGKFVAKDFYSKCSCGCLEMNLVQASKASRGKVTGVTYDAGTDKFYCDKCIQEVNNKHIG